MTRAGSVAGGVGGTELVVVEEVVEEGEGDDEVLNFQVESTVSVAILYGLKSSGLTVG